MLNEKRISELAGISRAQWDWEQRADARDAAEAERAANAATVERIPIPPKSEERLRLEAIIKSAFPYLGEPAVLYLIATYMLVFVGAGINGHRIRTWEVRRGRVSGADSPQLRALNAFLSSGLDWVNI